jgi:hypothetical protein
MTKSAASIAAEKWRGLRPHPLPSKAMSAEGKRLWREIVQARVPGFFPPGAQSLLRTYCEVSVALDGLSPQLAIVEDDG